jgi:hypothetical protein
VLPGSAGSASLWCWLAVFTNGNAAGSCFFGSTPSFYVAEASDDPVRAFAPLVFEGKTCKMGVKKLN